MNKMAEMLVLNFGSLTVCLLAAISLKRHKKFSNNGFQQWVSLLSTTVCSWL